MPSMVSKLMPGVLLRTVVVSNVYCNKTSCFSQHTTHKLCKVTIACLSMYTLQGAQNEVLYQSYPKQCIVNEQE